MPKPPQKVPYDDRPAFTRQAHRIGSGNFHGRLRLGAAASSPRAGDVLLGVKHTLRGLLFSWPAYVLGLAAFYSVQVYAVVSMLLLVPAVVLSGVILIRGVRDDYRDRVKGVLLNTGFARGLLFPAAL